MDTENKLGMNRTGCDMAPLLSKEMEEGTEELTLPRCPDGTSQAIGDNRQDYMLEGARLGSVPMPGTLKGVVNSSLQAIAGSNPTLLVDKLGERLAFERTGVRLYDALISKFKAYESELSEVVSLARLQEIRSQELGHFHEVREVVQSLGADPTAVTPAADVAAVSSMGLIQAVADPRIGFSDSLDAILIAELADNDCWRLLIDLVTEAGLSDAAEKFRSAYQTEQEHLLTIRDWIYRLRLGRSAVPEAGAAA